MAKKRKVNVSGIENEEVMNILAQEAARNIAEKSLVQKDSEEVIDVPSKLVPAEKKPEEVKEEPASKKEEEEKTDEVFEGEEESKEEETSKPEVEITEEEKLVHQVAEANYQNFLAQEKAELDVKIQKIKAEHKDDYDAYVESLKKSPYYQKCLEKWQKYYEDKKQEFIEEAKKTLHDADLTAKDEVAKRAGVVSKESKPVKEVVKTPAEPKDEAKPEKIEPEYVELEGRTLPTLNVKYKASNINADMKVDEGLMDGVFQILLGELQTSIDENVDFYEKERDAIKSTSHKMSQYLYDAYDFRAKLSKELAGAFNKEVYRKPGATVYETSPETMLEMQKRIAKEKGKRNVTSTAEVLMDKLVHYDKETKTVDGMLPALAAHIALKVQQELLKNGVTEFNLNKDDLLLLVKVVMKNNDVVNKVMSASENETFYATSAKYLDSQYRAVRAYLTGKSKTLPTVEDVDKQLKLLEKISETVDPSGFSFGRISEFGDNLKAIIISAYEIKNTKGKVAEEKKSALLEQISSQTKQIRESVTADEKVEVKLNEKYSKTNLKNPSLRAVVDKLVNGLVKVTVASNALKELNNFEFEGELEKAKFDEACDFIDKNREVSFDVTVDLLGRMYTQILDMNKKTESSSVESQDLALKTLEKIDNLLQNIERGKVKSLKDKEVKAVKEIVNDFITLREVKFAGKKREKDSLTAEKRNELKKELEK